MVKFMDNSKIFKITVLTDLNHFYNTINIMKSLLPINNVFINYIYSLSELDDEIKKNESNIIIINKASYDYDDIKYLTSFDYLNSFGIVMIDSYNKFEDLFLNYDKGFITVRRTLSINKFLEILKISILDYHKKEITKDIIKYRIIENAKSFLILYENMFEEDSHKYIEKMAMNNRTTASLEASHLISKYLKEKEDIIYEY